MTRTIATLAVMLSALCAYAQTPAALRNPLIVKRVRFTSQTALIAPTPIYTPKHDGLFRVSIYTEEVTTGANEGGGFVCPTLSANNDSGSVQSVTYQFSAASQCASLLNPANNSSGTLAFVIRAKANMPIAFSTYLVGATSLPPSPFTYAVYIVVERL